MVVVPILINIIYPDVSISRNVVMTCDDDGDDVMIRHT